MLPGRRAGSAGPDAIEFAESLGYELDDWQRWCIDGILSEDEDRRLCATLCLLIVPRQNGKNVVIEVVELYAFYVLEWQTILHSAHRQDTSADHMARLRAVVEANPVLDEITEFREANGKERVVRTDTRAEIRFVTRSKKIGRGKSPRLVVVDEALYVTDEQIDAMLPSMSAQSMNADKPIMLFASSAPVAESLVLARLRATAARGGPSTWYAEWSCEPGVDVRDRDEWARANPGLNVRISEEWIEEMELASMSVDGFLVERLGVVPNVDGDEGELPGWPQCVDPGSQPGGEVAVAIDVSPDLGWSSVGVASRRPDGLVHVELVEHLHGTARLVEVVSRVVANVGGSVHLDPRSPAAGFVADLGRAGVKVVEVGALELSKACAALKVAVRDGRVRHRGQGPLTAAVGGAGIRSVGDAWVWARRSSSVDISPLVAVTLASYALMQGGAAKKRPVFAW
jgi:phage terminase large subunit-like protein